MNNSFPFFVMFYQVHFSLYLRTFRDFSFVFSFRLCSSRSF
nr:MAG TPA: hypothetical protein [Caudoviricetes sp.]